MTDQRPVDAKSQHLRVFGFSLSFIRNVPLRRILGASGVSVRFGWPSSKDRVLVWGRANTAARGMAIARRSGASVVTAEDGFLRSVKTGRQGDAPHSVILDKQGIYFETAKPNDLSDLIKANSNLLPDQTEYARQAIAFMRDNHLSKYNNFSLETPELPKRFVLVIDQTRHDASIKGAGADEGTFQMMLDAALSENPDAAVVIKTHPETIAKQRKGHFDANDVSERVTLLLDAVSPWTLMAKAEKVYCVSSTMGLEAIFAGHSPIVFGNAFYCGLGLSEDRHPLTKALGSQTPEQLFHAAYVEYCHWYDPFTNAPTDFLSVARTLATQASFARKYNKPQVFVGMRLWKRGFLRRFFKGAAKQPLFIDDATKATKTAQRDGADVLVWSGKETPDLARECRNRELNLYRVEDGFLRSAGLGANLIEPVSLALDDIGIYYDPTRESRLERLIAASVTLPKHAQDRAKGLRKRMVAMKLSKYNLDAKADDIPTQRHIVLIPGQVEDDQSILKGAGQIKTNLALVTATREAFPKSYLIYKPHPDVMAGLRNGGDDLNKIAQHVDQVLPNASIAHLLDHVDCVSTITSLTGFEALLRGKDVICFGAPFYAGWGLTDDRGKVPDRRTATPTLDGLVHAAFIDYPTYWDPITNLPCTVETILDRFAAGQVQHKGRGSIRWLAKAQGLFASYAYLWR